MFHYRKALKSIMNVKNKVDSWSGTIEELYKELNGFNYNDHGTEVVFDCYPDGNDEVVVTLIESVNEPIKVITFGIEVWDDTEDSYHSLSVDELREYAEKEND